MKPLSTSVADRYWYWYEGENPHRSHVLHNDEMQYSTVQKSFTRCIHEVLLTTRPTILRSALCPSEMAAARLPLRARQDSVGVAVRIENNE